MSYLLEDIQDCKVCVSQTYLSFENYMEDLKNDLKLLSFNGDLILDMKSSNGLGDRFFKCNFQNGLFNLRSFKEFKPSKSFVKECNELSTIADYESIVD